jgi:hypothetical protein
VEVLIEFTGLVGAAKQVEYSNMSRTDGRRNLRAGATGYGEPCESAEIGRPVSYSPDLSGHDSQIQSRVVELISQVP